jgi:hypothetical protein
MILTFPMNSSEVSGASFSMPDLIWGEYLACQLWSTNGYQLSKTIFFLLLDVFYRIFEPFTHEFITFVYSFEVSSLWIARKFWLEMLSALKVIKEHPLKWFKKPQHFAFYGRKTSILHSFAKIAFDFKFLNLGKSKSLQLSRLKILVGSNFCTILLVQNTIPLMIFNLVIKWG